MPQVIKYLLSLIITPVFALNAYTVEDVTLHNTTTDCWMTYDNNVYDLTEYVANHDKFMDIREWCGKDMTQDFETKAGAGRDHREGSYALLENYLIGELVSEEIDLEDTKEVVEIEKESVLETSNPYNLLIPLISTALIYWISYFVFKKNNLKKFNAFWNSILFLTLIVPSFGFGIFLMLRYQFPQLYDINFDFIYWHVELSVVMGVIAISHFLLRLKIYLTQLGK